MATSGLVYIQSLYFVSACLGFSLAAVIFRNRDKPGSTALLSANICYGIWALMQLSTSVVVEYFSYIQLGVVFNWVLYPTVAASVVSVFVFTLEYTGRERYVTPRFVGVLVLYPVVVAFFAVVNPDGLFYTDFEQQVIGIGMDMTHLQGPAFVAHTLLGYVFSAGVFAMILEVLVRSGRPLYRGQAIALLFGVATPVGFNIVTVTGNVGYDLTVIGFIATSALFTVAMVRYDLINVTPIAREKVVENVRDGMVVVDTDHTILDSNPAFRSLFGLDDTSLAGTDVRSLLEDLPAIRDTYDELTDESIAAIDTTGEARRVSYSDRQLNVQSTPVYDDRDRHVGWLFLVHDVTELVQRERDLEGQIEKLDQFAGIVSHDLRNPLNVARGYVQQAQATGEVTHLDKTQQSLERMETIINEALELAREGGEVTDTETISLDTTAQNAWDNVETAGASIVVEDISFRADQKRFQRLLENLFRNSLEHGLDDDDNPSDHVVTVGYEDNRVDDLTLYVADNGVGIPDDEIDRVFEGGFTTNQDGTGLGLAIVDQIASAHGWETAVTHSNSGGARFELHNVAKPVGE